MGFEATLWALAAGLIGLVAGALGARRKPTGFKVGFVPWHAILFLSLAVSLLMAAHLPAVWPR
jgi:hypothetical protein|tara:strand:- start:14101 stop:14289 length:189 start_codon:yes stop_codon:yes gene_type:complete